MSSRNEMLPRLGSHRLQGSLAWKQEVVECECVQKWLDTSEKLTRVSLLNHLLT